MSNDGAGGNKKAGQGSGILIAQVDKDHLRSLFHLFVGKPDTTQKVFPRQICVSLEALADLHERISEKLRTHHTNGLIVSVDISFDDNTSVQFGGWAEFKAFRWTTPKATKDIRVKWHFLLSVQGYELPQQHALTIKLTRDIRPIEFLQAVLSKHPDDIDSAEISFAPMICRVDFISHLLGQELIAAVEQWNKSLPAPEVADSFMSRIEKHKERIAQAIEYSTPILFAICSLGVLKFLMEDKDKSLPITVEIGSEFMNWLVLTIIALYVSEKVSRGIAKMAYLAIDNFGRYSMFQMTNGDQNHEKEIRKRNKKHLIKFVWTAAISFSLNVLAGIFVLVTWPSG